MKKTILALAVIMTTVLTSAFANSDVNKRAVESFKKDFASAKNVSWQQERNFTQVTFSMYNHVMYAYYNHDGELLAVIRNILSDQLPIQLLTDLKKKYNDRWISELFEVATEDQTTYYVTLETSEEKMTLKSDGFNDWTVFKKEKKNTVVL